MMFPNMALTELDPAHLRDRYTELRGTPAQPPDVSIVIPVNADGDLQTVLQPLNDISHYSGKHAIEIILVINNYHEGNPPPEIEEFRDAGIQVVAVPDAHRPGEVVIVTARALGVRAANADITIHFDADCRIPDVNALIDWYVQSLREKAQLAYSHVDYYDLHPDSSVRVKIAIHHLARWFKRRVLNIPTTRGSNYAIRRELFLRLYDAGKISVDLQVGPATKLNGGRIAYSGDRRLRVFTSGRRFQPGWGKVYSYFRYRLRYNLNAIPTRNRQSPKWNGYDEESQRRLDMSIPKDRATSERD